MKPVPTRKFIKFLKSIGLEYKRTKGDHDIWDKIEGSLPRPVTFIGREKEIPPMHIITNLKTLNIDQKEFLEKIKNI